MKRNVIYARVSTDDQTTANQLKDLVEACRFYGWMDTHTVFLLDEGYSGKNTNRPGFQKMIEMVQSGQAARVLVWSLDRLGRDLKDLIHTSELLQKADVDLYLHKERVDTSTAMGKMIYSILGSLAEFERNRISERTKAGLARVKAHGSKTGNPIGAPSQLTLEQIDRILELHYHGWSQRRIAKSVGCSQGRVGQLIRERKEPA